MAYSTDKSTAIRANGQTMVYSVSVVDMNNCHTGISEQHMYCVDVDPAGLATAAHLGSLTGMSSEI